MNSMLNTIRNVIDEDQHNMSLIAHQIDVHVVARAGP